MGFVGFSVFWIFGWFVCGAGIGFVLLLVLVRLGLGCAYCGGLCGFGAFGWVACGLGFEFVVNLLWGSFLDECGVGLMVRGLVGW